MCFWEVCRQDIISSIVEENLQALKDNELTRLINIKSFPRIPYLLRCDLFRYVQKSQSYKYCYFSRDKV